MQVNRLFEIIYILLDKKSVTAKELAERFEVSTRTIYRDVDTLSSAGIPIYTEKGKGGGISLLPDFVLNKSLLSEREQNEILTALHSLSHVMTDETKGVLNRLSTLFNRTATSWLEVDFSEWSYNDDFFNDLKTGILERRIVAFEYFNTQGERSLRRAEPMQLWFKSRAWYIKAYCLDKNGMRLFKLSRIKNLTLTQDTFTERIILEEPPPPPCEHENKDVTFRFHVQPELAYRVFDGYDDEHIARQPDGSLIVTTTWYEDDWLYSYILSHGEYAEVLEPQHLRDTLKAKMQRMMDKYA
ncbi:MAG: YafY family transcriptional regulator [Defluviitaleaceae bacterium]|nr:YafY family transcriptional regulator [Defluviitaleaceae bacterium]